MTKRKYGYYDNLAKFIKAMMSGPHTLRELEAKTGIHYETLRPMMNHFRASDVVHISSWRIDGMGRASIACYQLGMGVDAPKRKPLSENRRKMLERARRQAEKEEPLKPASRKLVANNLIDQTLNAWR